jgi:phosphopantetheinyl transferase (holo-ACP synthase)
MISKIESKKDLNKYLENYLLKYKNIIITCNEFIKFLKNLYFNNHLNNKFEIKETMFKNIYYKIKRNLAQLNLEDINMRKNYPMENIFAGILATNY